MKKVVYSFFIFIVAAVSAFSQGWQNITPYKGGYPLTNIVKDKNDNLYVMTPAGMYASQNKGVNWSKTGKNLFAVFREMNPDFSLNTTFGLYLLRDTLYLKDFNFNEPVYYDKGAGTWKRSGRIWETPPTSFEYKPVNTSGMIGYVWNGSPGPPTFIFSNDGMKTWKSYPISKDNPSTIGQPLILNNTFYIFYQDSLLSTKDGVNFKRNKMSTDYSSYMWQYKVAAGNLYRLNAFYYSGTPNMTVERLDTVNYSWTVVRKLLYNITSVFSDYPLSEDGYLYDLKYSSYACEGGFRRTKDWGQTWENLTFDPVIFPASLIGYRYNFQSVNGKTYILRNGLVIQNVIPSGTVFSVTAPEDFGQQFGQDVVVSNLINRNMEVTKQSYGNIMTSPVCFENSFRKRIYWNGKWQEAITPAFAELSGGTRFSGTSYIKTSFKGDNLNDFYLSKNEGLSWQKIASPNTRKTNFDFASLGQNLYAVYSDVFFSPQPVTGPDTLFLSPDGGNSWTYKSIPSISPDFSFRRITVFKNKIYLSYTGTGTNKILMSSNGESWTDVTAGLPSGMSIQYVNKPFIITSRKLYLKTANGKNDYRYEFNEVNNSWSLKDSSYTYVDNIAGDTILRLKDYKEYELTFNGETWMPLSEKINQLAKGDTIVYDGILNNQKGIFAETNHGIFYLPYSSVTGLESEEAEVTESFTIYPNPSYGLVYIKSKEEKVSVKVTDLFGVTVKTQENWDSGEAFDLSVLSPGIYTIQIEGKNKKQSLKFVRN